MKNTAEKNKRQYPKYISSPLDSRVLFLPELFFKQTLTPTAYKIMEQLFYWASKYEMIFPAHQTIATAIGCTRKTVCTLMKELIDYGLLVKIYKRKTWCYALASWFKSVKTRRRLAFLFPILAIGLPALTKENYQGNVTLTTRSNIDLRVTRFSNLANSYLFTSEANCENNIARARIREIEKFVPKPKERVLSTEATISPAIDRLSFLTLAGKVEIAAYPDSIVQLASDNVVKRKDPNNPFLYFMSLCRAYSNEQGISPNRSRVVELMTKFDIAQGAERNVPDGYSTFCEKAKASEKKTASSVSKHYSALIPSENKPRPTKLTEECDRLKKGDKSVLNQFSSTNPFVKLLREQVAEQTFIPPVWWNKEDSVF
jgi:predicted transcriptional regulator